MTMPLSWSMRFALALCAVFTMGTLVAGGLSYVFLSREMTLRLAADTRASAESLASLAADGGLDWERAYCIFWELAATGAVWWLLGVGACLIVGSGVG